jgi:cytosine/adenosine deaminase-related metal-dependent hydrolase
LPLPGFEDAAYLQPETLDGMVADVERIVGRYHDGGEYSRRRVAFAPLSPGNRLPAEEMPSVARAARRLGIRLHSHLSENVGYVGYCQEKFGSLPVEFCAEHEWIGPDVWFAHMCHLTESEIALLARHGTGIAHCPGSNSRTGAGIAPALRLAAAGVPVSLAVDGTASNEPGDMLSEIHLALYLHRAVKGATGAVEGGADAVSIEEVIHWATGGGARVLGLRTGAIARGYAADLSVFSLDEPRYFGFHDRAIAPILAGGRPRLKWLLCGGRTLVEDDKIPGLDLEELAARCRSAVTALGL